MSFGGARSASVTAMTDITDIRLLGYSGFEASEHFLRALCEEIWVSRWQQTPKITPDRPPDLSDATAMRTALEQPSRITVISAHTDWNDEGRISFSGKGGKPKLPLDSIGKLGAESMVLIDACYAPELAAELRKPEHLQPGCRIVGLAAEPGEYLTTQGRDSITAIGAVIRELCYPPQLDLSPQGASRAVYLANIQINARNDAEHDRRRARPRSLREYQDP